MNDSADIKMAAERLANALEKLEQNLDPMLAEFSRLERVASESEGFASDRTRLATELDEAKALQGQYRDREEEFRRMAGQTKSELDQAITQVKNVLERYS